MTICVAALCDNGHACVVAADREITIGLPLNIGFEHHERKIDEITSKSVVFSSGSALIGAEVVGKLRRLIPQTGETTVEQIASALRDTYMNVLERAEQVILRPRGLSLQDFREKGTQQIPAPGIDQLFFNSTLNTEFLVAGVDQTGGHVAWIHYHGVQGMGLLEWFDKLGYAAIGSRASHATILLSLDGQHRDLGTAETVYNVYYAKANAEVAPGVGPATDLALVTSDGLEFFDATFMKALKKINDDKSKRKRPVRSVEELLTKRAGGKS
jgi:hypothetical protein